MLSKKSNAVNAKFYPFDLKFRAHTKQLIGPSIVSLFGESAHFSLTFSLVYITVRTNQNIDTRGNRVKLEVLTKGAS